ncbi:hypothetical protein GCM10009773_32400 [Williamsia serinedens]
MVQVKPSPRMSGDHSVAGAAVGVRSLRGTTPTLDAATTRTGRPAAGPRDVTHPTCGMGHTVFGL